VGGEKNFIFYFFSLVLDYAKRVQQLFLMTKCRQIISFCCGIEIRNEFLGIQNFTCMYFSNYTDNLILQVVLYCITKDKEITRKRCINNPRDLLNND